MQLLFVLIINVILINNYPSPRVMWEGYSSYPSPTCSECKDMVVIARL